MSRILFLVALVLCYTSSTTLALVCPPALDMAPCICLEETQQIECIGMKFPFDIKAVFDRVGPLVADDVVFKSLIISNTIITDLPAGTVESLKFQSISISSNAYLETISPDMFNTSTQVTKTIYIGYNYLPLNSTNNGQDIFDLFNKFTNLETLQSKSQFTSIPANAFGSLESLTEIDFQFSSIASIGNKAFSQLTGLRSLRLNYNDLTVDGIAVDAFYGIGTDVGIDMEDNSLVNYLPEDRFKPLLDNARLVYIGGQHCSRNGCNTVYLQCDERANWICQNLELYKPKLGGFRCVGTYNMVWDYCADWQ